MERLLIDDDDDVPKKKENIFLSFWRSTSKRVPVKHASIHQQNSNNVRVPQGTEFQTLVLVSMVEWVEGKASKATLVEVKRQQVHLESWWLSWEDCVVSRLIFHVEFVLHVDGDVCCLHPAICEGRSRQGEGCCGEEPTRWIVGLFFHDVETKNLSAKKSAWERDLQYSSLPCLCCILFARKVEMTSLHYRF